ncbi:hypothetical protein [Comamonas kerstersii]|uniref:hypothetical protein n=1 Tax=Comamonas kerstersii TaxID=225992 RepID=UPI00266D0EC0|nr:hypothetical protein [Comamonas kerstersii]
MSTIPFTDRELVRACRELAMVATPADAIDRKNPHRLLLFYAVECGLKAVWLKRQNRTIFDGPDINKMGHNLQKVLKDLNVGSDLSLPESFQLATASQGTTSVQRNGKFGDVHQAWRYGGKCLAPTDNDCEQQLQRVLNWIQRELR